MRGYITLIGRKEKDMWIDTRDCVPLTDGEYIVQTVYNRVTSMFFTGKAGWNTHYDTDGNLIDDCAMDNYYVVRWHEVKKPKAVPKEWLDEYWAREGVTE